MATGEETDEREQRLKQRIHALEEQLRDAVAAKTNPFILDSGHDLRSPLNSIIGYAHLMMEDSGLPQTYKSGAGTIYKNANLLLDMINTLIDIAKIEAGTFRLKEQEFVISSFIQELQSICRRKTGSVGIGFELISSLPGGWVIKGDRYRVEQILLNLLNLSIQSLTAGSVKVKVSGALSPGEKIGITFLITAAGSRRQGFAGKLNGVLGTRFSLQLTELMGGQLIITDIQKNPLPEFEVFLEFPLVEQKSEPVPPKVHHPKPATRTYSGKIMIVDDLWESRMVLDEVLSSKGFTVMEADGGYDALNKMGDFEPDIVILDIVMPDLDGFETLMRIRGDANPLVNKTKVVIASGQTSDKLLENCLDNGADDYVIKPIDFDILLEKVLKLLNISGETHPTPPHSPDNDLIIAPKRAMLEQLHHHIDHYDYGALLNVLSDIEQADSKYIPFVKRIRAFAGEFLQEQIVNFLEKYMH